MNKKIFLGIVTLGMVTALSSCGKENIDLSSDADVIFNGYDGYGTAAINEGSWVYDIEEKFGADLSLSKLAKLEDDLDDAVEFSLSSNENLKNGDEVTLTIDVDNDVIKDYDFKLSGGSKTFTVEGLEEIQSFDPFENVAVNFGGMSPNGTATVNTSDANSDISLNYVLDKESGLKNGDEVTLSIASNSGSDVEEYCLSNGKIPTATEKTFTVEGLAGYATKFEEIPEDTYNKMLSQAEDTIKASASSWSEGNSIKKIENIGYYFLTPKEGFETSTGNELYCVYKITADITGYTDSKEADADDAKPKKREDVYYTFFNYNNIVLLEDGTCSVDLSSGQMTSNTVNSKYGQPNWFSFDYYTFKGYSDLDSMFNDCITSKISNYTYENTVQ